MAIILNMKTLIAVMLVALTTWSCPADEHAAGLTDTLARGLIIDNWRQNGINPELYSIELKKGDVKFTSDGGVLIYNDYRVDKKGTDTVFELSVAIVVHKHSKE
jgi:hypothetical protein